MTLDRGRMIQERPTPGDKIRVLLEERGWSQRDLALVLGLTLRQVNQLISGKQRLTPRLAILLEEAVGTSAEEWLALEAHFRISEARGTVHSVGNRAQLLNANWKEWTRRKWIKPSKSTEEIERRILEFLGVSAWGEVPADLNGCFRKSTGYSGFSIDEVAWCRRVLNLASQQTLPKRFSPIRFKKQLQKLLGHCGSPDGVAEVPEFLANCGVHFVVVKHLPKTRIDGAMLWLDPSRKKRPVIALSMRYDRIDYFWFSLFHECAHLLHRHQPSCDSHIMAASSDLPEEELAANQDASSRLLPPDRLSEFLAQTFRRPNKHQIETFARQHCIHAGIVVGQLQHRGILSYSTYRDLLEPVRSRLLQNCESEGWEP